MNNKMLLIFLTALFASTSATQVFKCGTRQPLPDANAVKITNCVAPPCILKKSTIVEIEQRFTPDHDIDQLTTHVYATIVLGIPLPFIGVDGISACDKLFTVEGEKASCPLKKGVEYIYRNGFPILPAYPRTSLTVHWALLENFNDITCFEVPAKII